MEMMKFRVATQRRKGKHGRIPKKNIYLWTGNGWGKTTSAFGAAIRALGHGYKVVIVQFMKGRKEKIGEYRIRKRLGKNFEIRQFGRIGFVNPRNPAKIDRKLAMQGFSYIKKAVNRKKPFLLVLDEINVAVKFGLLNENDVIRFVKSIPKMTNVYMTGRYATKKLMRAADYVNKVEMFKGPKKLTGEKGIDY